MFQSLCYIKNPSMNL